MSSPPPSRLPSLLLLAALAWSALAIHSAGSEPVKAAGVLLAAALLCLRGLPAGRGLWPLLACGLVALVATALALDPAGALAGSHARALGLASVFAALLLAAHTAGEAPDGRLRVYRGIALLAGLVAGYALLQRAGLDPLAWRGGEARRPAATLGNATVLAGWLLLSLPASLLAARAAARRGPWLLLVALQLAALAASGTRSAWLALAVLGGLLLLGRSGWRRAAPVLLAGALAVAGLLAARPASLQDRAYLWSMAAQAIAAPQPLPDLEGREDALRDWRAWIGYGPDQQRVVLDPLLAGAAPARPQAAGWAADRAHQLLLDLCLQSGLMGLLALAWLAVALAHALHQAFRQGGQGERAEALALAVALAGWLLHLQFAFAMNADLALAAVLAGCALAPSAGIHKVWHATGAGLSLWLSLLASALLAVASVPWGERLAPARAAEASFAAGQAHYAQALATPGEGPARLRAAALAFERAARLQPRDRDAALAAASAWVELAAAGGERSALPLAQHWLRAVEAMTPGEARLARLRGRIEAVSTRAQSVP